MSTTATATYLTTLRRIPDDIVLSMATREIVDVLPTACICGWAIREAIARESACDAAAVSDVGLVAWECERRFGGAISEWNNVFLGICDDELAPILETAFVTRVMEAAGVAS